MISKKPVSVPSCTKPDRNTHNQNTEDALTKIIKANREHESHQLLNFNTVSLLMVYDTKY